MSMEEDQSQPPEGGAARLASASSGWHLSLQGRQYVDGPEEAATATISAEDLFDASEAELCEAAVWALAKVRESLQAELRTREAHLSAIDEVIHSLSAQGPTTDLAHIAVERAKMVRKFDEQANEVWSKVRPVVALFALLAGDRTWASRLGPGGGLSRKLARVSALEGRFASRALG
jgi:hypothetical protein